LTAQLSAENLTLFRGDRCLFRGVSFALNEGELLILEGSNGSGKTSLMRAIVGMLDLEKGVVSWNGNDALKPSSRLTCSFVIPLLPILMITAPASPAISAGTLPIPSFPLI